MYMLLKMTKLRRQVTTLIAIGSAVACLPYYVHHSEYPSMETTLKPVRFAKNTQLRKDFLALPKVNSGNNVTMIHEVEVQGAYSSPSPVDPPPPTDPEHFTVQLGRGNIKFRNTSNHLKLAQRSEKRDEIEHAPGDNAVPPSVKRRRGSKGTLSCSGIVVDSEVIYWRVVPGDSAYKSPIMPLHDDKEGKKFLTFRYDMGGWNNVRMGVEIAMILSHAMGRTLVKFQSLHCYVCKKNDGWCDIMFR